MLSSSRPRLRGRIVLWTRVLSSMRFLVLADTLILLIEHSTPVSGKSTKTNRSYRSKAGSQTPNANVGSPSGNNQTPIGPCRYDSPLGLLTKKFVNLLKHTEGAKETDL
ncbi:transcription factor E2FB-like isoform X2 [Punica granatum]|uniref:Transcription factor E2FB-like isoform X2 n=1 Tax=Punica granatum TaxID=22663 RepID=A0A6P8CQI5_PUNGR|nr:transcription factor E2FB-like isoform X2 [Punica granatum]XP_031386755.1 transcription factor E2FB-like isoform X2 [Punica granatum]XP_031386756.1 transcription factor E2FB-like isoform X2 [Punica granatum]XP_031386757.1 transcription factor E2FB-like isoform X2 [Punica granatum]